MTTPEQVREVSRRVFALMNRRHSFAPAPEAATAGRSARRCVDCGIGVSPLATRCTACWAKSTVGKRGHGSKS